MEQYRLADRVRIDILDETDADFRFYGEHGMILSHQADIYEVTLDNFNIVLEVAQDDVRPPFY